MAWFTGRSGHQAEGAALVVADHVAGQSAEGLRELKRMFRDLEGTDERIAYENERLVHFQRHGAGPPQG